MSATLHLCISALLFGEVLAAGAITWTNLNVPREGKTGFVRIDAAASGLHFTNRLTEHAAAANRVLETGSGVAAGDFDSDGWVDLFFCSLDGDCRLFRNAGNLKFQDVTAASGIQCKETVCRGAVFADIDGDADPDLLVSAMGRGVLCFRNRGDGTFEDATAAAGTANPFAAMTMALADVDGNGTIDLYVTNYRTNDVRDAGRVDLQSVNGRTVVPRALQNRYLLVEGKVQEFGEPDLLYLNDGTGRFRPVSWIQGAFRDEDGKALTRAPMDWGLSAAFRDLNNDGSPDLYVCNDYWTPDRIWMNDGKGGFAALPASAVRHTSASSMGIDFADIDRDGSVDFFVVDMLARTPRDRLKQMAAYTGPPIQIGEIFDRPQLNRNTLFLNRGDGTFDEIAEFSGLEASEWSWQPLFMDVDLDGFEDLLIASGHTKAVQDHDVNDLVERTRPKWPATERVVNYNGRMIPFQEAYTAERMRQLQFYPDYHSPIFAFRNSGNLRFEDQTAAWGFSGSAIHHGMASADLDNDGDLDVAANTLNSTAEVWINKSIAPRVAVELRGRAPNTDAIGAKVALVGGAVRRQTQEVTTGGKYLSSSQRRLVFATENDGGAMKIEVVWRTGATSVVANVQANHFYVIEETGAR